MRVMSFGLGDGCDSSLITSIAEAGKGTATIVNDNSSTLNGDIIRALGKAMEPMLCDTSFGFHGEMSALQDYGRNALITSMKVMPVEEFDRITFRFKARDAETGQQLDLNFTKADFKIIEGDMGASLLKLAIFK